MKSYQNQELPSIGVAAAVYHLLNDGFTFIMKQRRMLNTDVFAIKTPGMKVMCIGGEAAAAVFYDPEKFVRKGAVPLPVQKTLTGVQAIHTTDGAAHSHRKALFMSLMSDENVAKLQALIRHELEVASKLWAAQKSIVLFHESATVLCRAICAWAGVPLTSKDAPERAKDFISMVDAFSTIGPRHFKGRQARRRAESWITSLIEQVRAGTLQAKEGTALDRCATFKSLDGNLVDPNLAAIELINLLRPTVAISWYICFAATALFTNDSYKQQFEADGDGYQERFINEVRRFFPFAPFMGAKVRKNFEWNNIKFPKGCLVLLDMYGTNHDDRLWDNPFTFIPERFALRGPKPFDFLAQGGGDPETGHRCPGEYITIESLKTFLQFFCQELEFELPKQDMTYAFSRMPTAPKDGIIIGNIKVKRTL